MVGSHQLSPEAKEKAAKRRAKQAAEDRKSAAGEREQAQQLKRQEKRQEELVSNGCLSSAVIAGAQVASLFALDMLLRNGGTAMLTQLLLSPEHEFA